MAYYVNSNFSLYVYILSVGYPPTYKTHNKINLSLSMHMHNGKVVPEHIYKSVVMEFTEVPLGTILKGNEMKVVILAGGFGTRISEESHLKPKPMVEIGDMPILWHIMKYYSHYGFKDFIICLGYKQYVIKEFFADYFLHTSDVSFDLTSNEMKVLNKNGEDWKVTLIDTGLNTMTGGRVKRILDYIDEDDFLLTYGDGLSNVDINKLVDFHKSHKKIATITTVSISNMKGVLDIDSDNVITSFREKEASDEAIINGGYMVLNKKIGDYIADDTIALEKEPFAKLAEEKQLMSFRHKGFWQCMDTQREMKLLNELWSSGKAPWKLW